MVADRWDFRDVWNTGLIREQLEGVWCRFFTESFSQAFFMRVKLTMRGSKGDDSFESPHNLTINSFTYTKTIPTVYLHKRCVKEREELTSNRRDTCCQFVALLWVHQRSAGRGCLLFMQGDDKPTTERETNAPCRKAHLRDAWIGESIACVCMHGCAEL